MNSVLDIVNWNQIITFAKVMVYDRIIFCLSFFDWKYIYKHQSLNFGRKPYHSPIPNPSREAKIYPVIKMSDVGLCWTWRPSAGFNSIYFLYTKCMLALKLFLLLDYLRAFLVVIGSSGFCLWSELRTSLGKF